MYIFGMQQTIYAALVWRITNIVTENLKTLKILSFYRKYAIA